MQWKSVGVARLPSLIDQPSKRIMNFRVKSGRYVVLGGPDGTGKSTLVEALRAEGIIDFQHRHWRPGLLPSLAGLRGREEQGVNTNPHGRSPDSIAKAWFRTLYYWLDFVLGYFVVVRPELRRGRHFILERGWSDVCVDPLRYGLRSDRLARLLARFTPRADIALFLDARPELIVRRKAELTVGEVRRQLEVWRGGVPAARRTVRIDAEAPPPAVAASVSAILVGEAT
jgi:thymidylate kinase